MIINRRRVLRWALGASYFGLAGLLPRPLAAMVRPGIREVRGDVRVNGRTAMMDEILQPGDTLSTAAGGQAIIVVDANAYLLHDMGEIILPEKSPAENILTVVSGRLLSVFGPGDLTIDTPVATIGIRGTGAYVEVREDRTYVCLCYGWAELISKLNPDVSERQNTVHHNEPRNFYADPAAHGGVYLEPAKMVNHMDEELIMLEALVGRIPLFGPEPIKMP